MHHIRKATLNDLTVILSLSDELTLSDLPYDKRVDVKWAHTSEGRSYYSERINGEHGVCFVAELEGKIVGYTTAQIKKLSTYRLVKVAEVENLVVEKEFRSKGIGKALLDEFLIWAREKDADRVSVSVFSSNEKGIEFYKREGFADYDTTLELKLKTDG